VTDAGTLTLRQPGPSQHSLAFELDSSEIKESEMRTCSQAAHVRGGGHKDGQGGQPLSHEPITKSLRDCEAAVCGGNQTGQRGEGTERRLRNRSK
jgi:hypothetical protein